MQRLAANRRRPAAVADLLQPTAAVGRRLHRRGRRGRPNAECGMAQVADPEDPRAL
jgi:hypothetical protein